MQTSRAEAARLLHKKDWMLFKSISSALVKVIAPLFFSPSNWFYFCFELYRIYVTVEVEKVLNWFSIWGGCAAPLMSLNIKWVLMQRISRNMNINGKIWNTRPPFCQCNCASVAASPLQMCAKLYRHSANVEKTQSPNCSVSIEKETQLKSHVNHSEVLVVQHDPVFFFFFVVCGSDNICLLIMFDFANASFAVLQK